MSRRSSTVERRIRNARVGGSTPLAGSIVFNRLATSVLSQEPDCGLYVGFWTLFEAGLLPVTTP